MRTDAAIGVLKLKGEGEVHVHVQYLLQTLQWKGAPIVNYRVLHIFGGGFPYLVLLT